MVDDIHIDYMYTDEEQREEDERLRKKLGDKEFEKQKYGIVEKSISDTDMSDSDNADDDLPVEEILEKAQEIIDRGGIVLFKFTCEYCGSRQTSAEPNTFHSAGYYCDECKELCRPKKYGTMAIFAEGISNELVANIIKGIVDSKMEPK